MPYSAKNPPADLKKRIKKRHPDASTTEIKQFINVFNSVFDNTGSEARAFAQAWGVLNKNKKLKSSHEKTNPKKTKKDVKKWEKKNKIKVKKSEIINVLIKIASELDNKLLFDHADEIDLLIKCI